MLKRGLGKKNLVGLDIGSSSVKAVELDGKRGSLQLVSLGYENLQPDSIVDGQIMELNSVSNVIANIFREHQIKTDRIAAGVSGHSVIVKNIVVPQMSEEELDESIDWHAEEHIPFDISDVSLDYQITGKTPEALQVLMAACKRDKIANLKQAVQLAGKQPAIIDVDAFALQNCYEVNYQPQPGQIVALLNIGASTMNINILNGTRSVFTRDVTVGGNQFTAVLQKELGLTHAQAEAVKRGMPLPAEVEARPIEPILETVSDILALEIQKTMDFYRATAEDGESAVQRILISGGGSKLPNLAGYLSSRFEMPVEVLDPFRQIKVDARRFDPDYMREVVPEMAVAVGLALRGADAQSININLLESVTDRPRGVAVVEKKVVSQGSQTLLLAGVVFGLLFVSIVGHYFLTVRAKNNAKRELENQQQIAAQMAAIIKEQDELKRKTKDIVARIDAIKALRSSQQGPGAVLRALKERIDSAPGLYLESVEQKGEQLVIRGNSPNEGTVTQFGRSLEFSSGLFSNLNIETVRKEMPLAIPSGGIPQSNDPNAPKPETVDFTIKCAYTPGNVTQPSVPNAPASPASANPPANQVAQK